MGGICDVGVVGVGMCDDSGGGEGVRNWSSGDCSREEEIDVRGLSKGDSSRSAVSRTVESCGGWVIAVVRRCFEVFAAATVAAVAVDDGDLPG